MKELKGVITSHILCGIILGSCSCIWGKEQWCYYKMQIEKHSMLDSMMLGIESRHKSHSMSLQKYTRNMFRVLHLVPSNHSTLYLRSVENRRCYS
ncbi:hypothetical protein Patl1_11362 [Pistacia atlantica]|uniref:Uncharacterized protein n=1 Tax=Pistacia atlantica TaxID=434234 RepID=A0ACC1A7I5_9ROSI|nr:hypothetical protein Patl1_11362 [Pistacia atlantica]